MAQRRIGRQDKTPFSASRLLFEFWWAILLLGCTVLLLLWHAAVVIASPAGWTDYETTLGSLARIGPLPGDFGFGAGPIVVFVLEILVIFAGLFALTYLRVRYAQHQPGKGMLSKRQHKKTLTQDAVLAGSRDGRLWPPESDVPTEERTFHIGTSRYGFSTLDAHFGQEEHLGVIAPTGVGKTYRATSRAALTAPGPVVVTSTKPDLLDLLAGPRSEKGKIWVFDLLNLVSWPEPMRWDLLRGCEDSSVARARAGQVIKGGKKKRSGSAGGGDSNSEFFEGQARNALQCYLHAAALSGEYTIGDVVRWATEFETDQSAMEILSKHPAADPLLQGRLQSITSGAPETVASTRNTLDEALSSLALERISEQFTDPEGVGFDPFAFATSNDTLVIIADDNDPTDVTNLAAMLLDTVFHAAKNTARHTEIGRLSPPLRAVLDEVANIAPIPNFPEMLSDLRSYGIQIIYAFQGRAQARRTWGEEGAQMLVDNSAGMLMLGGTKDPAMLKDMSELAGMIEVTQYTTQMKNFGAARGQQTLSEQDKNILRPDEFAKLDKDQAMLITGKLPPVMVRLPGWTELPNGKSLERQAQQTASERAAVARSARATAA